MCYTKQTEFVNIFMISITAESATHCYIAAVSWKDDSKSFQVEGHCDNGENMLTEFKNIIFSAQLQEKAGQRNGF